MTTTVSHCPGATRTLAQAAGVEPAYLGVKVPCLTIWLRLYMSPLSHIVERCAGSCAPICQALKVLLRRGSRVALLSDLPSLLFPRRQVDLSRFLRLTFTVGCDPVFWCRRLGLNQRIPPGAVLCLLSYVCISPASAGVRRKERMDGMRIRI